MFLLLSYLNVRNSGVQRESTPPWKLCPVRHAVHSEDRPGCSNMN